MTDAGMQLTIKLYSFPLTSTNLLGDCSFLTDCMWEKYLYQEVGRKQVRQGTKHILKHQNQKVCSQRHFKSRGECFAHIIDLYMHSMYFTCMPLNKYVLTSAMFSMYISQSGSCTSCSDVKGYL